MATLISGLGGPAGYGENVFSTSAFTGNLDDGSINVNVSSVFGGAGVNLYGTNYTSLFVNTNGLLTFASAEPNFTPANLTTLGQPSIAPFWTDIDIRKGGEIYWDLDPVSGKFTVTWLNVAAFNGPGTNSFQMVMTNLGGGDFGVEFIYQSIGFTNGNNGQAMVGVSNGTNSQTLAEGSGDPALLSTYASNDFDTNDPIGVYSMQFEAGVPFAGDGVVDGTAGDDNITTAYVGDPDGDRIDANDATGFAGGTGHDDYVLAGAGNDTVASGLGNDQVYGGSGNDVITAGNGNDTVYGEADNDSIDGGSGNDLIYGGSGDNTLAGGAASTATTYTPAYTEVTAANQTVTGTNGRPNFNVTSTSSDNDLTAGNNGAVTGFRLGNNDSVESHTHTASSQIAGGQILFNAINSTETLTISIDGTVINITTAVAAGIVTFNGNATYAINGTGQIIRIGSGSNVTTVGTLTINVPYTSVTLAVNGATSGGAAGLYYEYYTNTNPQNIAAAAGGDDTLFGGLGNDLITGGTGNDSLLGEDGNDTLDGGDDNDLLFGGIGNDSISGGAGNDSAQGDAGNDTLAGGTGNDSLYGGGNDDLINGDAGNDLLQGDTGNDTLIGGDGNDIAYGGDGDDSMGSWSFEGGDDTLFGGLGNDIVYGGMGDDQVHGDDGNDTLSGGFGTDSVFGGLGSDTFVVTEDHQNDTITGGENAADLDVLSFNIFLGTVGVTATFTTNEAGLYDYNGAGDATGSFSQIESVTGTQFADTINAAVTTSSNQLSGNAGSDVLTGGSAADSLYGGADNDTLAGGAGADDLQGDTGNDSLVGDAGNDTLAGGDGADRLFGGLDADALFGGAGDDTMAGGDGADSLDGGTDNDVLAGDGGNDTLTGGAGNDNLDGGADNDLLAGDGGNDTLTGGTGNDSLSGGADNDVLTGDAGADTLSGGTGNDNLSGGADADTLDGGDGADTLAGGSGADVLTGGLGADTLQGGDDQDTLFGGSGDLVDGGEGGGDNDTLILGNVLNVVYGGGNNESGTVTFNDSTTLAFSNIENLVFGGRDGIVNGTAAGDLINAGYTDAQGDMVDGNDAILIGETGNDDIIQAGDGNDTISAGLGNDDVFGGSGNDSAAGGAGNDSLDGGADDDTLAGEAGNDTLIGGLGNDLLDGGADNDSLSGGDGNDTLTGGGNSDTLAGGAGDDSLEGGTGNDTLTGDAGNDALTGGAGDDSLDGGAGNDTLFGDIGVDSLYGGDDEDRFVQDLNAIGDVVYGGGGGSVDNDVLDLTAWGWALTNIVYDPMDPENGTVEFLDGAGAVIGTMDFFNIEQVIPCFTPGVMIATDRGEVAVEHLRAGDLVVTRDGGLQPVRWVGQRQLGLADLIVRPELRPVRITAGALGAGLPRRDTLVSPQHRMLIEGAGPEMLFGEAEVLVAALHLTGLAGVDQRLTPGVCYIHVLLDRHEIIRANGSWTESFQPADRTLGAMDHAQRAEIAMLFPELVVDCADYQSARLSLKAHEARVLLSV